LSAVFSGVKDIRAAMEAAEQNLARGKQSRGGISLWPGDGGEDWGEDGVFAGLG
jgi:hypothetical protein